MSSTWGNRESFGKQLQDMLAATVEARLEGLVQQMVPKLANKAFIEVLGSYWDAFHQSCETAEDNIQNQVDEGGTELKSITNDGIEELEKCGKKYLNMLKSRGNKLCDLVEAETHEFLEIAEQESGRLSELIESQKTSQQQLERSRAEAGQRCVSV
jgi:TRAP-type mannitol/chloroaromatic compound transport system substrate-binding protein